tara:strand:+ start:57 stop:1751 length:1695 start_codon:yes stop_codon:yes gene_type:complete
MARFSQGLFSALANPSFAPAVGALGEQIGSAQAVGKQQRRRQGLFDQLMQDDPVKRAQALQAFGAETKDPALILEGSKMLEGQLSLQSIQEASALANQGTAFAQQGKTQDLQDIIGQLTSRIGRTNNAKTVSFLQAERNRLQSLVPDSENIATTNSIDRLMSIDSALADTNRLRQSIAGANPRLTNEQVETRVRARTDALEKERSDLLSGSAKVNEGYQNRRLSLSQATAAQEELQAEAWLQSNRESILAAIKSGDTNRMEQSIASAPPSLLNEAEDYLAQATRDYLDRQELEKNSIAVKQSPEIDSFKEQISSIKSMSGSLDYDTSALEGLNTEYENFIKKHWDGEKWTTIGHKSQATAMEKNLRDQIFATKSSISDAGFRANASVKAADESIIREAMIRIEGFIPSDTKAENLAEVLAAEDEKIFDDLRPEEQALYISDARFELTEENRRANLAVIASVDPSRAPAITITEEENVRFTQYSKDDQKEIMEEYSFQKGQMSLAQVMKELEEDQLITPPEKKEKDKPKEPVLYTREPGFRFMDRLEERYEQNVRRMADRRSGQN